MLSKVKFFHFIELAQISKEEFIQLARKSGNFNDTAIEHQQRVLKNSGIGDETYMPRAVFRPGYKIALKDGREESATVMFGAINELLPATKIQPKDIRILVLNFGVLKHYHTQTLLTIHKTFLMQFDLRYEYIC
jgi:hypothetical protein